MVLPARESITRSASLAGVAHEDWMQDWPMEVADGNRLIDFLRLLERHRDDWELTYWFLDLVLESARGRRDLDRLAPALLESVVSAVAATRAPGVIERLKYWACADSPLDDAFEVSPIARAALLKLVIDVRQPGAPPRASRWPS
jgi:hypothetical protein